MTYMLGKAPAQKIYGVDEFHVYVQGKLPSPPSSVENARSIPRDGWGMMGNDVYGNCTIAGAGHMVMAWNAETDEHEHVPDTAEADSTYLHMSGGADTGLVEVNVLDDWRTEGLFGSKILTFAPLKNTILALHQAIAFYGGAYLGIQCPQSMQQDFGNGVPISYHPGSPIEGGHCIVATSYSPEYVGIVTWGQHVLVTYPFLAAYLDESYVIIPNQFVAAQRGPIPGIDLAALEADLNAV